MKDTLTFLVQKLLNHNHIPIDNEELSFQIQSHPSYPSLHAITAVLDHFSIQNMALSVKANAENLSAFPSAFLGQIQLEDDNELALVIVKNQQYHIQFSKDKKEILSQTQFLKRFTGIILGVDNDSIEEKVVDLKQTYLYVLFSLAMLSLASLIYFAGISLQSTSLLFLNLVGAYISFSILKQELGLESTLGNAFCSAQSEKKNCNIVLASKGATLYKRLDIKLSDLSLVYFVGLTLSIILYTIQGISLYSIYYFSLLSIPVTIYSLYYQSSVLKQWCPLCLGIVGILWLQTTLAFITLTPLTIPSISLTLCLPLIIGLIVTLSIWLFLKPFITSYIKLKKLKISHYQFKRDFDVFQALFNKSARYYDTTFAGEIILGNPKASLNITIITNPFCGHCKAVHTLIEDILKRYQNKVKLSIRFNIDTQDQQSDLVQITSRLLEIYHQEGQLKCLTALQDIYIHKTATEWLTRWKPCAFPEYYIPILKQSRKWCLENNINFTPEILINGQAFPSKYERPDLIFFIEELSAQIKVQQRLTTVA